MQLQWDAIPVMIVASLGWQASIEVMEAVWLWKENLSLVKVELVLGLVLPVSLLWFVGDEGGKHYLIGLSVMLSFSYVHLWYGWQERPVSQTLDLLFSPFHHLLSWMLDIKSSQ